MDPMEVEVVEKYWTEECTNNLISLIKQHGDQYIWHACKMFESVIGLEAFNNFRFEAEEIKRQRGYIRIYYNLPMRYAERLVELCNYKVPRIEIIQCEICGANGDFNGYVGGTLNYFLDVRELASYGLCLDCVKRALFEYCGEKCSRQILLERLNELALALGKIPPLAVKSNKSMFLSVPPEKKKRVLFALIKFHDPTVYKLEFGSWFDALVQAKLLDDDARPTGRGTMCKAKDGHLCLSISEKIIDDWLSSHMIQHEKEPLCPYDEGLNKNNKLRADWRVGNVYIEYFGLVGDKKMMRKWKPK